ncbi:MAG TPA: nuclear transport factor 2 family protein [Solirubrobacteraceae bacterium]|nr:nuclear transport factor 2 family protein [Solirubrobacteraceae bacterium]
MSLTEQSPPPHDAPQLQLVDRLYSAFAQRDGDTMAACYEPDARFSDPVFANLQGEQVGAMWRMLAARAKDFKLEVTERSTTADGASVSWVAHYTFSQTGRPVVNRVRSELRFGANGLIAEQRDEFDFHRWARQALGAPGLLFGWLPPLRASVQRKALAGLDEFMQAPTR